MKYFLKALLAVVCLISVISGTAQDKQPVQFNFSKENLGNGSYRLFITAKPQPGVQVISMQPLSEDLPVNTVIRFDSTALPYLKDSLTEKGTLKSVKSSALNNASINVFEDSVVWQQGVQLKAGDSVRITGVVNYYYLSGEGVESGEQRISLQFIDKKGGETAKTDGGGAAAKNKAADMSLWGFLLAGFLAGLIGFITPCVYALVPVTVSIFLKRSKTPAQGKKNALFYATSIILIYTLVGVLSATVLPDNALNNLSTNWIFNLFIFALFVIFGLSFLGAFDINLPASWANKLDSKANNRSYAGIFFMALTLVVVSFSCTGNFVAGIIGLAPAKGKVIGMFGFGLGLALPFAIFAFAPSLLKELSKSGGWQNAVKVTLGFIELALALKFLSNADLDRQWGILDREVFIVLWVVLFALLGMYLLGKLRFKHDSELPKNDFDLPHIPVSRLMLAITALAFALYLIPGLWGAPLKVVSAFVPPMGTQDFVLSGGSGGHAAAANPVSNGTGQTAAAPVRYASALKRYEPLAAIENNFTVYYDYNEALAAAKLLNKPLLLDFTGIQCVNCREFESKIWIDKEVATRMKNDFVIASLYTDYNAELDDNEKFYSKLLGSQVETVGDKFEDFQQQLIGTSAQPNYVFLDTNGKLLVPDGYGYDPTTGAKEFVAHLDKVTGLFKAAGK